MLNSRPQNQVDNHPNALPVSNTNVDETQDNAAESFDSRPHRRRYLCAAFMVAIIAIAISGLLFRESDNEKRGHFCRALSTSLAWSFSSVGGTILTSLCFSLLLSNNLRHVIRRLQSDAFG